MTIIYFYSQLAGLLCKNTFIRKHNYSAETIDTSIYIYVQSVNYLLVIQKLKPAQKTVGNQVTLRQDADNDLTLIQGDILYS